jgi:hypothetical protein
MELRKERIELETREYHIRGTMTLPAVQRLSDALNDPNRQFLALSDVSRSSKLDGSETLHAFMAVSRAHVITMIHAEQML